MKTFHTSFASPTSTAARRCAPAPGAATTRAVSRTLGLALVGFVMWTQPGSGQDRPGYREFRLGADVASVSAQTAVAASEAKTVHARPALIQQLEWRRRYSLTAARPPESDPVQQIVFSFFNDQLFKVVVDYDRERTAGMTDADMIEGISTAYGPPLLNATSRRPRAVETQVDEESGPLVARWGGAEHSVVLYRVPYTPGFRLVVIASRLDGLARVAAAEAVRLDDREAPQREIARLKKEAEDLRISQEKTRLPNKAAFRP